jgi:hypothetical protein
MKARTPKASKGCGRWGRLLLTLLLVVAVGCGPGLAADGEAEYKIKAGFLLNFAKFTTWPVSAWQGGSGQFTLCVVGVDPFGTALSGVTEKQVDGKGIRLVTAATVSEALNRCQVLFVSRSEQNTLERLLRFTAHKPIMTVSDIAGFAEAGGIIELKNRDDRLSFTINNSKAKESELRISAALLNLAIEVR